MNASITGYGVLSAAGDDPATVLAAVRAGTAVSAGVADLYEEPLPSAEAPAIVDFDVRAHLGRKGTSFLDRATALALVACGRALADRDLPLDDENRHRVGVVLGTTIGSLKSTMDFSRETLVQDKPYLVNPVLFPNTVMNCASGQSAIRYGLRGPNATVAGGPVAFLSALRYAVNALRRGYADALLVGGVEEFTPNTAWAASLTGTAPAGEAAAVYVVENPDALPGARRPLADVLSVATGFGPGDPAEAVASCVRRAVVAAGVRMDELRAVASGDAQAADSVRSLLPRGCDELAVRPALGECQAAGGALALSALLGRYAEDAALHGRPALIAGVGRDGAVAAAVVRGWRRAGDPRG
jgi:3-oxoacyl-[acyl-carrier-protein] synthase II